MPTDDPFDPDNLVYSTRRRNLHKSIPTSVGQATISLDMTTDPELSDREFRVLCNMMCSAAAGEVLGIAEIAERWDMSVAEIDQFYETLYDIGYMVEEGEQQ